MSAPWYVVLITIAFSVMLIVDYWTHGSGVFFGGRVEYRFFKDPDTGQPHIYRHGVTEKEVEEIIQGRGEDLRACGNSRRKIGQTAAGRCLQVFYVPDEDSDGIFVITAYEPQAKAKKAFRRRQRRRRK